LGVLQRAILPIAENETLFNLIGTTYGGDGQETFALPNLQSRFLFTKDVADTGTTYQLGEFGGVEQVTLTVNQLPSTQCAHVPANPGAAERRKQRLRKTQHSDVCNAPSNANMAATAWSLPAEANRTNMMPFLCISFIISLFGVFPQQN
jgi:microcystin-dependent protein